VSRRLLRLEQDVRAQLLHRDARKLALTPAGRRFYEAVAGPVDALSQALGALEQSSSEPAGKVRVTAPPDLGRRVLAPMFVAFLKQYPEISLELSFTNRMVDLAEEGVDLAVRAGRAVQSALIARRLCASELQLAASPSLALPELDAGDVRSLERLPFVLYRARGADQTLRLEHTAGKRRRTLEVSVHGRVSVDDYAAMAELVAAGQGIGLMPSLHLQEGVEAGRLVRLFPDWAWRASHIYLVSVTRQQPERVRLLAEFLVRSFQGVASV
ncbi:MAG TPA: LysR substrate-binding domain-containing protein, partial [Polyangiales bacterium]